MESFLSCRVCLTTDVKLYDMNRYRLKTTYEDLCGNNVQVSQLDALPHHVCTYCAALLYKFSRFKQRCEQARGIMEYLLLQHALVTTDHVRRVNRIEANVTLPYTTNIMHNIDSTSPTEIKEEKDFTDNYVSTITSNGEIESKLNGHFNGCTEYDTKEFVDIDYNYDYGNDSDDEPLSKKVKKSKKKKEDFIGKNGEMKDQNMESVPNWENNDFDLVLLSKEEQLAEVEARKGSSNYQNSLYKCDDCYRGFMTQVTFRNHMFKHDPASGPEVCDICHTRWADARARKAHSLVAHERKYICRVCSHTAKSHHKAKEHMQWHRGHLFSCQLCGSSFEKSTTYLTHLRLQHPSSKACDACGDCFLGENGLNMHKKKAHKVQVEANIQYLECSVCDSKFRNEEALKRHIELADNQICDTKLRWCAHCGDGLPSDESYREHADSHRRLNSLRTCNVCSRTFANERKLANHRARAHSGSPRGRAAATRACVCEICGYFTTSRASLVYHQRVHTGEKPYTCSVCPKRFSVYQRLQIHIRTHTGERPYKCAQCPKAFKHKAALNRHDRVHTGARPYCCPTCGKAFSQSNSMKQHAASVHLKAPLYARKKQII